MCFGVRQCAIILDLEDAIAPSEKANARARLADCQDQIVDAGIDCIVRVNSPLGLIIEDIWAVTQARPLRSCFPRSRIGAALKMPLN